MEETQHLVQSQATVEVVAAVLLKLQTLMVEMVVLVVAAEMQQTSIV
jgi:hypothetical protein